MQENESYHLKGKSTNPADWIVSFSDLCKISPQMGGHPKIFYAHMCNPDPNESKPSMNNGNLLHSWIEKKSNFIIQDQDKPGEKMALFAETIYAFYFKEGYKTDPNFQQFCKQDYSIDLGCLADYKKMSNALIGDNLSEDNLKLFIYAFRYARVLIKFASTWGEPAILKNFMSDGYEYLKFLLQANGKIIMTKQERDIATNAYEALREHPLANRILFETEGEHEKELFWEEEISGLIIKRKAKLDKLIIDPINKILTIPDLKTTNYPVANFANSDGSYHKYGYGEQLASYAQAYFIISRMNPLEIPSWKVQLLNIVVQTNNNFPVIVYKVESIAAKTMLVSQDLQRVAYHIKSNNWVTTYEEQKEGYISIHH